MVFKRRQKFTYKIVDPHRSTYPSTYISAPPTDIQTLLVSSMSRPLINKPTLSFPADLETHPSYNNNITSHYPPADTSLVKWYYPARITRARNKRYCPWVFCNCDSPHTHQDLRPLPIQPPNTQLLPICRFDRATFHPFRHINVWVTAPENVCRMEDGAIYFLREYGMVELQEVAITNRDWRVFNCVRGGVLQARVAHPIKHNWLVLSFRFLSSLILRVLPPCPATTVATVTGANNGPSPTASDQQVTPPIPRYRRN